MIVILGLIVMVIATIVALVGVLANSGSGHALGGDFSVFGYDVTGSSGNLFLHGLVVGAVAMLGLNMVLGGVLSTSRRGRAARTELKESRHETERVARDRDELLRQRETESDPEHRHPSA